MSKIPTVQLQLPPKLTKENTIGYTFGLRPYREGGIRLERENIKEKVIYHNYGHGGGGVSLAPGCSKMIVELFLLEMGDKVKEIAILGGGYMGLFQAIQLADLGFRVNLYAKDLPIKEGWYKGKPLITSQVAGGFWMPYGLDVSNKPRYDQLTKDSFNWYLDCIEKKKYESISWKDNYTFTSVLSKVPDGCPKGYIEPKKVNIEIKGSGKIVEGEIKKTIMIDGDTFLNQLLNEAKAKGVYFNQKEFESLDDVLALKETVIFNCLSWGSYFIFGDRNMIPIAGHLWYMKKMPDIDYFFSYTRKDGWSVSTYPQSNKLAIGMAYEKIGWINAPVEKTLNTILKNWNEMIDEFGQPTPKL